MESSKYNSNNNSFLFSGNYYYERFKRRINHIRYPTQKWSTTTKTTSMMMVNMISKSNLISRTLSICFFIFLILNCAKSDSIFRNNSNNSNNNANNSVIRQQLVLYSILTNRTTSSNNNNSSSNVNYSSASNNAIILNENYKVNTRNLERVSRMIHDSRMKSACVQAGLWAIFYTQNYQNVAAILYASSNSADQTCTQNKLNETAYAQYKSIRYIGNANLLASGLSLYSGPFFSLNELYFNGQILSLPSPQIFQSYGFTGNDSWTLYEHTNFSGQATCLMASGGNVEDVITNTFDRVIYNKNKGVDLMIGSIQRGCIDKSNRTLIFPSGETVVQWTNKPIGLADFEESLEIKIHNNKFPSLKLISELDGNVLTTDASELRLPKKYTFNRFILNTGQEQQPPNDSNSLEQDNKEISWTVFSGHEFTGRSKCFHSKSLENNTSMNNNNASNNGTTQNTEEINFDSKIPFRQELFLVGSIKAGCFENNDTEELPVLELHLNEDDYEIDEDEIEHNDSLFFISFIIGLLLLLIVILLSISMIAYFYIKTRRRQRREEREARAMRS